MYDWRTDNRTSYDTVAAGYAEMFRDGLGRHPAVRGALAWFAEIARDAGGPVLDAGCGIGHLTARLRELGLDASGLDLSPGMLEIARRDHPGIRFEEGDLTDLQLPDASLGGVLLFFSIIHVPDPELPSLARRVFRALRPGGVTMVGFHVGDEYRLKTEGYGTGPTRIHLHLRPVDRVAGWLRDAGLGIEATMLVDPDAEVPAGIVVARRPA